MTRRAARGHRARGLLAGAPGSRGRAGDRLLAASSVPRRSRPIPRSATRFRAPGSWWSPRPGRLHRDWLTAGRARTGGDGNARSHVERLLAALAPGRGTGDGPRRPSSRPSPGSARWPDIGSWPWAWTASVSRETSLTCTGNMASTRCRSWPPPPARASTSSRSRNRGMAIREWAHSLRAGARLSVALRSAKGPSFGTKDDFTGRLSAP